MFTFTTRNARIWSLFKKPGDLLVPCPHLANEEAQGVRQLAKVSTPSKQSWKQTWVSWLQLHAHRTTHGSQASQLRNSESNCPRLRFSRNTPCWSSNSQKQVHQDPVLSYDRWVELQNHIATGDLWDLHWKKAELPTSRLTGERVSQHLCCKLSKDIYSSQHSAGKQHSPSLGPSSISGSLSEMCIRCLWKCRYPEPSPAQR